ncbi:MAG: hypothetical protein KatS3mg058_0445 [Roseiflexus sp.]|nr:MAG: hypothetical protein KatS3mg058_0445 [Roseiflexus sp.]
MQVSRSSEGATRSLAVSLPNRADWRPDMLVCPPPCPRSRSARDMGIGTPRLACAGILMPEMTDTT